MMAKVYLFCLVAGLFVAGCSDGTDGTIADTGSSTTATAAPPSTTLVAGAPTLLITANGPTQGTSYDTVTVAGKASLSGNLQLDFTNGYKPSAGQRFVVLTAVGGIDGRFNAVTAQGIGYTMAYDANSVTVVIS